MEEVLKTLIENLVDDKESVSISSKEEGDGIVTFNVKVAKTEMGKVIGKQGRIAHSIRTIMKSVGAKEHKKVEVEFIDEQ